MRRKVTRFWTIPLFFKNNIGIYNKKCQINKIFLKKKLFQNLVCCIYKSAKIVFQTF